MEVIEVWMFGGITWIHSWSHLTEKYPLGPPIKCPALEKSASLWQEGVKIVWRQPVGIILIDK